MVMPRNDINDFIGKIEIKENDDCLYWKGRTTYNGYGLFNYDRAAVRAHRYIYEHCVGKIPDGLDIDHLCRNRSCVNPSHLEPVTRKENINRGWRARRSVEAEGYAKQKEVQNA